MMLEEPSFNETGGDLRISWWEAWLIALTRPNLLFYESLAQNPSITTKRACLWILIGGLFTGFSFIATRLIYGSIDAPHPAVLIGVSAIFPPIVLVLTLIMLVIVNASAKSFGGEGTFEEFIRPVAAFSAPIAIIMSIFALIPFAQYANYGLALCQIGLMILSVKAVHRIGWGSATISCIIFIVPSFCNIINAFQFAV